MTDAQEALRQVREALAKVEAERDDLRRQLDEAERDARRMDKLKALLARCKCGVYLTVNEHRDYYETPEERIDYYASMEAPPDISDEVRAGILRTGNIVGLQFYPDTPIGFYHIVHYDLDAAIDAAMGASNE